MDTKLFLLVCSVMSGLASAYYTSQNPLTDRALPKRKGPLCPAGMAVRRGSYPGLFRSPRELQVMRSGSRISCGRLNHWNYAVLSTYGASCSRPTSRPLDALRGSQGSCNYVTAAHSGFPSYHPCCQTNFQVVQPFNVTSAMGQSYQVRHFDNSVQVVHVGTCQRENAPCWNGGRCQQEYRMDWLLVVGSPDHFIPVEVPSHGVCVFT